jgi:hypothetical protein
VVGSPVYFDYTDPVQLQAVEDWLNDPINNTFSKA